MSLRNLWFGLDESIRYVTQRRNFTRKEYARDKIAAFDTETQAGNIQTWHFATLGTDESKDKTGTLDFRASGTFTLWNFTPILSKTSHIPQEPGRENTGPSLTSSHGIYPTTSESW